MTRAVTVPEPAAHWLGGLERHGAEPDGIAVVVWGVFTFHPWVFAAWGPAVLAAGLAI